MRVPAAAAALLALAAGGAGAVPDEKPFPTPDRSVILREEGTVYLVEGRIRIPRGVEVSCQKDVYIRARGSGPAVIEVEGSFKAHGVGAREIIFEGVTVEPAATFGRIQIEHCIFRKGGGVATQKDRAATGPMRLEACKFQDGARLDLGMCGEALDIFDVILSGTMRLRGVDVPDGPPNRLKACLRGCFSDGLEAVNVADLTVRINAIGKDAAVFRDCGVLIFDGNKVEAKELAFHQTKAGGFARTQVMKCDIYSRKILFQAPKDDKRSDAVTMDKCWFEGVTGLKEIGDRIADCADDPKNNVRVSILNPQERPLELAGRVNR